MFPRTTNITNGRHMTNRTHRRNRTNRTNRTNGRNRTNMTNRTDGKNKTGRPKTHIGQIEQVRQIVHFATDYQDYTWKK